jgi:hypothetical protein
MLGGAALASAAVVLMNDILLYSLGQAWHGPARATLVEVTQSAPWSPLARSAWTPAPGPYRR